MNGPVAFTVTFQLLIQIVVYTEELHYAE